VECALSGREPLTNAEAAAGVVEILETASISRENGGERIALAELARV
jgi:hypothetical protein